jgi:hypothetical protein
MYLTVPSHLKSLEDNYLQFKKDPAFALKSRGWKGKLSNSDGFKVSDETRLIFRDEKKLLGGYTMQSGDVIIDPLLDTFSARKALDLQIKDLKVNGIPIVKISTLPWVRPTTAPRQVDMARARASCLILDPLHLHADRKSERWTPVMRTPLDTDVWVILDSYIVENISDFYWTFESDRDLLESKDVGGKMPQVIGYRNTKANPVNRAKLKGTEFRVWRNDGYVKLLLSANAKVAEGLAARVWSNVNNYGVNQSHVDRVGKDHPVGLYMAKVIKGAKDYNSLGRNLHSAIYRAFQSMTDAVNPAEVEWKQLVARYPLLAIHGRPTAQIFADSHANQWIEYLNIIDLHLEMAENTNEEEKEAAA